MVGGVVIGIARKDDFTLLHVQEIAGDEESNTLTICTDERTIDGGRPVTVELDDEVWWDAKHIMWTPRGVPELACDCGKTWDIRLRKLGFSQ